MAATACTIECASVNDWPLKFMAIMTRSSQRPRHAVEGAVQAEAQARHFELDLRKLDDQEPDHLGLVRLGQVRCLSCRTGGQLQAPMDEMDLAALEEGQPEGLLEASPRQVVALLVATWSRPLAGVRTPPGAHDQ